MICPHCHQEIDDHLIAVHIGGKGRGVVSARKTESSRRNVRKAIEARMAKRLEREQDLERGPIDLT